MTKNENKITASPLPEPATLLKDCRHGKMLFLKRDKYIGRSLDVYGEFSEFEGALFAQVVRPGQRLSKWTPISGRTRFIWRNWWDRREWFWPSSRSG
jgi:hypothetical protein